MFAVEKIESFARSKFFKVFFKLFPIPQTLWTNTAKREILSSAQLVVFAVAASEIFAATRAALKKNHVSAKDAADCVQEFFNVVVAFDGEDGLLPVVFASQVYEEDELFFFNPWKLEGFLVQNRHLRLRTCSF
jgi:hypothetical protein